MKARVLWISPRQDKSSASALQSLEEKRSMPFKIRTLLCVALFLAGAIHSQTQNAPPSEVAGIPVNYDEARAGTYKLPDPLVLASGRPVREARTWVQQRLPEIVRLFEEN